MRSVMMNKLLEMRSACTLVKKKKNALKYNYTTSWQVMTYRRLTYIGWQIEADVVSVPNKMSYENGKRINYNYCYIHFVSDEVWFHLQYQNNWCHCVHHNLPHM